MSQKALTAGLSKPSQTDLEALVKRAQKELPYGTRSFEKLIRQLEPSIYRYCRYVIKDPHLAEDGCQNTLVRLFQSLHRFEGRSKFTTWLYRVCYNECLKIIDKNKINQNQKLMDSIDEIGEELTPVQSDGYIQDGVHLQTLLSRMKDDEASAVVLKHVHGYTFDEIAEIMDLNTSAVKMKLYRLYERVKAADQLEVEALD